jgi:hypothetical protein
MDDKELLCFILKYSDKITQRERQLNGVSQYITEITFASKTLCGIKEFPSVDGCLTSYGKTFKLEIFSSESIPDAFNKLIDYISLLKEAHSIELKFD